MALVHKIVIVLRLNIPMEIFINAAELEKLDSQVLDISPNVLIAE